MKTNCSYKILIITILVTIAQSVSAQTDKLIERHFKALVMHDVKAIAADYSEYAQLYSPNWEGSKTGAAGVTEVYNRYFSSTPDLVFSVSNVIYAGENVIVEYTSGGTLSNPEAGTPSYMKDKKYSVNCCAIFLIKNNKIQKETEYFDQLSFLKQVGFFDQK